MFLVKNNKDTPSNQPLVGGGEAEFGREGILTFSAQELTSLFIVITIIIIITIIITIVTIITVI